MRVVVNSQEVIKALLDNPFPYPEPTTKDKWKIIAETSAVKLYRERLKSLLNTVRNNSIITSVVGRSRAGKTHFLRNLEWRMNEGREYRAVTVYMSLTDRRLKLDDVIDEIVSSEVFIKEASKIGFKLNGIVRNDRKRKVKVINEFIDKLQSQYSGIGLILIVDNFDEYLRQIKGDNIDRELIKAEIERLLGVFRLLITQIPKGLLVIFSLTEDAYGELRKHLEDPTLVGRIVPICDDFGRDVTLSKITFEEAIEIVRVYMDYWAKKRNLELPKIEACTYRDKNIFPFTPEAVELFLKAGEVAGYICWGCHFAIQDKARKYESAESFDIQDLVITAVDAAKVIQKTAPMWPAYKSVKSECLSLIMSEFVENILPDWIQNVGRVKYGELGSSTFEKALKDGFKQYLEEVLKEKGAIIDSEFRFSMYSRSYTLHYLVTLGDDKRVGIMITNNGRIKRDVGYPIALALQTNQITHGIFIYYGEAEFDPISRSRLPVLSEDTLSDLISDRNYTPVVDKLRMDSNVAWMLVYMLETEDEIQKKGIIQYTESKLKLAEIIDNLIKARPKPIKTDDYEPPRAGDLLDRAGA